MNIVLSSTVSNYFEIFSLEDLDNIHETLRKFFSKKGPVEAKILSINFKYPCPNIKKKQKISYSSDRTKY